MSVHSYILDTRVISLLHNDTVCVQCGVKLTVGDHVHSKRSSSGIRRLYCDKCARELYIIDSAECIYCGTMMVSRQVNIKTKRSEFEATLVACSNPVCPSINSKEQRTPK